MWSNFGANQGKLDPGMKTCWPVWNSVSVVVSKQVITYNAAPKKCPTKDMIFVDGIYDSPHSPLPLLLQLISLSGYTLSLSLSLFSRSHSLSGYVDQFARKS
jgi:hypothetical protein